jgi:hypothetical protein
MRILSILFILMLVFTISVSAQSQEKKGCASEKSCVVKTCEDGADGEKVHIKGEEMEKAAATSVTKEQKQKTAGVKAAPAKKETKKE